MWCPDGYFLIREAFNEANDLAYAIEEVPDWLDEMGSIQTAEVAAKDDFQIGKISKNTLLYHGYDAIPDYYGWEDIYVEAVRCWLLARFIHVERFNLYVFKKELGTVRVTSEVTDLLLGGTLKKLQQFPYFPREAISMVAMALFGSPRNIWFPAPEYRLNANFDKDKISSIVDLINRELQPFNGAPLLWKSHSGLCLLGALQRHVAELDSPPPASHRNDTLVASEIRSEILRLSEEGNAKAEILRNIKLRFPSLSVRGFYRHWDQVAETTPSISKPGRKS